MRLGGWTYPCSLAFSLPIRGTWASSHAVAARNQQHSTRETVELTARPVVIYARLRRHVTRIEPQKSKNKGCGVPHRLINRDDLVLVFQFALSNEVASHSWLARGT